MPATQQRVAMITGGNSGIGFATVNKLAAQGFHVILASRNQQASAQAIARIRADNPSASVESIPLDLASLATVRQCAAAFQAKGYPLHVLINNAGGIGARQAGQFYRRRLRDDLRHQPPGALSAHQSAARRPETLCPGAGDHGVLGTAHPGLCGRGQAGFRLRQSEGGKVLQPAGLLPQLQAGEHVVCL